MHIYIYICICIYIYIYTYLYLYIYIDNYISIEIYISLSIYLSLSLYIYIYIYIYTYMAPLPGDLVLLVLLRLEAALGGEHLHVFFYLFLSLFDSLIICCHFVIFVCFRCLFMFFVYTCILISFGEHLRFFVCSLFHFRFLRLSPPCCLFFVTRL